jgi:hypothetical protein
MNNLYEACIYFLCEMFKIISFVLYVYVMCFYDLFHILWPFLANFGFMECNVCVHVCKEHV